MAGTSGDDHADRGSAPAGSAPAAGASDPLGDRRIGEVSESGITQPRLARASVAPEAAGLADVGDDASADPVTDPYATDPFADPVHREVAADAIADPSGDATPGDDRDERAEAYQLALRGLQRRVAAAEAQEPALREQLADLQRRLAAAEARRGDASSRRRRLGLAVAIGFAAGLIVMFAVSRLSGDRGAAASGRGAAPAANPAPPAPIVTPIDLPAAAGASSGATSAPAGAAESGAAPRATGRAPARGDVADPFADPFGDPHEIERAMRERMRHDAAPAPAAPRSEVAPRDAGAPVDPFAGR